jgi:hypothetical protein
MYDGDSRVDSGDGETEALEGLGAGGAGARAGQKSGPRGGIGVGLFRISDTKKSRLISKVINRMTTYTT